jgi:cysteinyl-tRNA synthetase
MHNNFLVERRGKMSKSAGEFLRLPLLVEKGYHPLAYRMMCLQAHYRSELEFSWEGLGAALTRLKRILILARNFIDAPQSHVDFDEIAAMDRHPRLHELLVKFDEALADDLNTPIALTVLEEALAVKKVPPEEKSALIGSMFFALGLSLPTREELRIRPAGAKITESEITNAIERRKLAREDKDFATSDALRDELAAKGVEVMDGDPLGWEWRLA